MSLHAAYLWCMSGFPRTGATAPTFNFVTFDKRTTPLVKRPEVTIQARGTISFNASAYHLLGQPEAVELLYDPDQRVIGFRMVPKEQVNAYPIRGIVAKGAAKSTAGTFVISGRAFFQYFGIPHDKPVRREADVVDGVLVVDLKDPGRDASSNRAKAKAAAAANTPEAQPAAPTGDATDVAAGNVPEGQAVNGSASIPPREDAGTLL